MPTRSKSALDMLLERRQPSVMRVVLLCVCGWVGFCSLLVVVNSPSRGTVVDFLLMVEFMAALALPLLYTMHNGLMGSLRANRFLESSLLTGLTASEWSDGLLLHGLKKIRPALLFAPALAAIVGLLSPASFMQSLCWVPVVLALMVLASYVQQVRGVLDIVRPGRELWQIALAAPFLTAAWLIFRDWFDGVHPAATLAVAGVTLVAMRFFILSRLERLLGGTPATDRPRARAMRPWSGNLIVMRESWRSARRGGALTVYARRFGVFLLFTGLMAREVQNVGFGLGPWFIYYDDCSQAIFWLLWVYALVAVPLVYWSTLTAVYDERRQQTATLLESTPMSSKTYRSGWVDWATRYRNLELLSLYSVALMGLVGCLWAETGWNLARWAPRLLNQQVQSIEEVVSMGLATWMWTQIAAHVALAASRRTNSGLAMQLELLRWTVPYAMVAAIAMGVTWMMFGPLSALLVNLALCFLILRMAAADSKASLEAVSGALKLSLEDA